MTGFVSTILQRINVLIPSFVLSFFCLTMGMFKQCQCLTAGRFSTEYLAQLIRLVPSTVCLAIGLLFFSAAGALAWEPGPDNYIPVADAGSDRVVGPGAKVKLDGRNSITRRSGGLNYSWARTGGTPGASVALTRANRKRPKFIADRLVAGDDDVIHTFTLTVRDTSGTAATDTVTITVDAPEIRNFPPVANAGPDQVVASGTKVRIDGRKSSDRDGPVSYLWEYSGGTGNRVALKGVETWSILSFNTITLPPGAADITYNFTLTVTDNQGLTDTDTVTITVTAPPFPAPVANAGPDLRVESGDRVTLDGTDSSGGNRSLIYAWARTGGTRGGSVALNGANTALPTFTADILTPGAEDVIHVFTLTVTDDVGASHADTVMITVEAPEARNLPPVANAGQDQRVVSGTTVRLDGSNSSDTDGTIASWSWRRTGGTPGRSVVMTDANTARPRFTTDILPAGADDVIHGFTLTVTDNNGAINTDWVWVWVKAPNLPPVADAGPDQVVASGETHILDGSGSTDIDGSVTGYHWWRIGGNHDGWYMGTVNPPTSDSLWYIHGGETLKSGEADLIHKYNLRVIDDDGAWSEVDTVTITTISPFAAPVANAGSDRIIAAGRDVILDGTASTVDRRRSITSYSWNRTGGTSGESIVLTGANTARPVFTANALEAGADDVTHIFELTVRDSSGESATDTVTITVESPEAPNLPPIANAGPDQVVASGGTILLDGSGSIDNDGSVTGYHWWRTGGNYISGGYMGTPNPPSSGAGWNHGGEVLKPGAADLISEFNLRVIDDDGAWSEIDKVTVTVISPFAAPVANAGPDETVAAGTEVILDGTGSTVDRRRPIKSYNWTRTGGTGSDLIVLTTYTASPIFTADALDAGADDVTHVFELTVTDSAGNSDSDTVTITVEAPKAQNLPPVANAGQDQRIVSGTTVRLDGSNSSDTDGTIASWSWRRTGGTPGRSVVMTDANTARPRFTTDILPVGADDVVHGFTLTVTDNDGAINTDWVWVRVKAPTSAPPPYAHAGLDRLIASGATIRLDGRNSTTYRNGDLKYNWERTGGTIGSSAELIHANKKRPTFTANTLIVGGTDVTHIFTLTVTDSSGATGTDTVTITVEAPNARPVAYPGSDDRTIKSGERITLIASGTDVDGTVDEYLWSWWAPRQGCTRMPRISGTFYSKQVSFTAHVLEPGDDDIVYCLILWVIDNEDLKSNQKGLRLTVKAPKATPVANAGPDQTVASGAIVTLDGTGSEGNDGTIASYAWLRTGGTSNVGVNLSDANTDLPSFTADILTSGSDSVTHIFTLTVTDDSGESTTDTVTITVDAPNLPPVANAGPNQVVAHGTTVRLNGVGTDNDGDIASYSWARTGGTGGPVVLINANTAQPSFAPNTMAIGAAGETYTFALTITDNDGATATDIVTITVQSPFATPVANAGQDQSVYSGATVTLDGLDSIVDRRRNIASYAWLRTGGTSNVGVTLSGANTALPSFIANTLAIGADNVTHVFTLTVSDDAGETDTDIVTIMIVAPFSAPVADAGEYQSVLSGTKVTLDGSDSTVDPSRTIRSWSWTRIGGTGVDTVALTGANTARPTFIADTLTPGATNVFHVFTLKVTDSTGRTDTDTVTVLVESPFELPVANAGKDRVFHAFPFNMTILNLNGTRSTHDRRGQLTYSWARTGGIEDHIVKLHNANKAKAYVYFDHAPKGNQDAVHEFTLTVTDHLGRTSTDTMTITRPSPARYLIANAGDAQYVQSGSTVTLDGSRTNHRMGIRIASWAWEEITGSDHPVTLSNAYMTRPTFTADLLAPGDSPVTRRFSLTVTDKYGYTDTDTVRVTVVSPFENPVANAGPDQTVISGALVSLNGEDSTFDRRSTLHSYNWEQTDGTDSPVTLTNANTANPTFIADTLTPGAPDVTHIFTLTVKDSTYNTSTDTVTITVQTPFAFPVADAGKDQSVPSGTKVTLDGNGSTVDSSRTIESWSWTRTGGTGVHAVSLTDANMATPTFTANSLAPGTKNVTHVFTLRVTDSAGETDTDTVTVTVESPFAPTVAHAGNDQEVLSGTTVILDGSGSTTDYRSTGTTTNPHRILKYTWARTGGTIGGSVTLNNASAERPVFTADSLVAGSDDVIHVFTLTVTDEVGGTDTDTVTITVTAPSFVIPVANAGPDRTVAAGMEVILDGTGSTVDHHGTIMSYAWKRTGGTGSPVTLTDANTINPVFTADALDAEAADVTHVFELTVTNSVGNFDTDTVTITVEAPEAQNLPPVANAGQDQRVASGATVTLDGSDSTHDHPGSLNYTWTRTGGTSGAGVILSDASAALSSFTADTLFPGADDVTHVFTLTVTNEIGETGTDTVTVTVEAPNPPPNQPPVPNAGPDLVVASGETFNLDASGSTDSDGSIVSYYWWHFTYVSSSNNWELSYLGKFRTPTISLTAETIEPGPANKTYETYLLRVVDDDGGWSGVDTVRVTVTDPFEAPIANAGPDQVVASGATVTLDGSGSTHDHRRNVSYSWEQTDESGSLVSLINADTAIPGFTADTLAPGANNVTYVFTLTVTDEAGETDTDIVTITVIAPFAAPVANAGDDQLVPSGAEVTLDGSDSTVDSSRIIESWSWTRTGGTGVHAVDLTDANMASPTFIADTLTPGTRNVTHVFTLSVTDSAGATASDKVTITVEAPEAPNLPPVANAGPDQVITPGDTVTLDGSASTDTDGTITYSWRHVQRTSDSSVQLNDPNTAYPSFTAILYGEFTSITHSFVLTVTDDNGAIDEDTVLITIEAPNLPPVADAGPDIIVTSGSWVALDGNGSSDMDGPIVRRFGLSVQRFPAGDWSLLTYAWARTGGTPGSSVALDSTTEARSGFTADILSLGAADVTHIFTLTVTDDDGAVDVDTVTVTVKAPEAPIANAGPDRTVASGATVHLDGSGSTGRDGIIIYSWTRTGGTADDSVTLSNLDTVSPTFTAGILTPGADDVTHIFTLTVTNETGHSDTDTMIVTVESPFVAPVANAGPDQTVFPGAVVSLDGSGSTTDFRARPNYAWTRTGGTVNVDVDLSDASTIQTDFTVAPLENGMKHATHVFTLTVMDNETGEISTDTVTITVESPLVANAGKDQLVLNGTFVVLDSIGSTDRNGTIESYSWTRIGGTSTHVPSFSVFDPGALIFKAEPLTGGDADVTHIFELTVTNNTGQTDTDTVTITVTSGFAAPVANPGDDQVVHSGEIVYLDGSGSLGLNDDLMTYAWTNMNETEDSIILIGADTAQPSFNANTLAAGSPNVTHVFSLTVTNEAGIESEAETMTVTVMAPNVTEDVTETALQEVTAMKVDILVSAPEMTVQEGGSVTYRVKLGQSPGQKVMVEAFSAHKDVTLEQQRFAFTAGNWNEWRDVRINTVADSDTENDRAKIEHRFVTKAMTSGQSGTITVTLREIDPILTPVGDYLASRATALLNNQPGLSGFLKRDETTPDENNEFALHATNDRLTLNGGFIRNGTWGEITGSYANSEAGDTKSVLASFGVHRKLSENLLAGAMLQFDLADHDLPDRTGVIDGTGWLVGPYFAGRHGSHPLYFEGRLLYGQSGNDIRFIDRDLGTRTGSFDTTRMLAHLRMEGEIALTDRENGSQLLPYVDAGWIEEKAAVFTDTTGNRTPGQKVSTGQLEFGSNLRMPVAMNHGAMTLTGGLGVVWSNTKGQYITSDTQGRGRGEIGFSYDLNEDVRIDFESFYDGIGTSDYESYGLSLHAEMKF